jgi:hypothetical protein
MAPKKVLPKKPNFLGISQFNWQNSLFGYSTLYLTWSEEERLNGLGD